MMADFQSFFGGFYLVALLSSFKKVNMDIKNKAWDLFRKYRHWPIMAIIFTNIFYIGHPQYFHQVYGAWQRFRRRIEHGQWREPGPEKPPEDSS